MDVLSKSRTAWRLCVSTSILSIASWRGSLKGMGADVIAYDITAAGLLIQYGRDVDWN